MSRWGVSDSGILRKSKPKENHDDLLVFGYACKLFREDEKAQFIDQGKHLIPWMGDDKLKIDRYDCRGALSDLRPYEASREGFDAMRWLGLSESERKLEELCDSERYYSLEINEAEEEMYKEEEQKRQTTNAFQYSYDVPMENENSQEGIPTVSEADEDEDYIPLPSLDVPVDIAIPKTIKENTRIEKTALFVCKQGPQMEILIKAKQGDNPQFSFLSQGDTLYKYYRHVLSAFKSGRYHGHTPKKTEPNLDDSQEHDTSGHYLHPSLISTTEQSDTQTSSSTIPTVPYKPSANCAYSQLVNRIQGNQNEGVSDVPAPPVENTTQMTVEQQQYYQYYYAAQYYEYYKQLAQYQQAVQGDGQGQAVPPPDIQLDANMQNYIQQMAYAQYLQHQQGQNTNSYAQIVSNVNKDVSNPYSAMIASLPQTAAVAAQPECSDISKQAVIYSNSEEIKVVVQTVKQSEIKEEVAEQTVVKEEDAKKTLLSLAQYGSDTEGEGSSNEDENQKHPQEDTREIYKIPMGDTQVVIDKMAAYVAKNGEQFEEIVKKKGDPRFEFLNDKHEYNKYYREKVNEIKAEERIIKREIVEEKKIEKENGVASKVKDKKVIAPVSFSIKKPKEDPPKEIKSALPVEESDDDEETTAEIVTSTVAATVTSTTTTTVTTNAVTTTIDTFVPEVVTSPVETGTSKEPLETTRKNGIMDGDDPLLEMIDLTDDLEERKDAKRAEDKIKDKLAAAAREKMASAARDRALQLERKRKAAAFLKLKSAETGTASTTSDGTVSERSIQSPKASSRRSSSDVEVVEREEDEEKIKRLDKIKRQDRSKSKEKSKHVEKERSRDRGKSREKEKRSRSPRKEETRHDEDSDSEDGDVKRRKKSTKKKKSHKRKHSRSKHESKTKKKTKKRHRRSESRSSDSSIDS